VAEGANQLGTANLNGRGVWNHADQFGGGLL